MTTEDRCTQWKTLLQHTKSGVRSDLRSTELEALLDHVATCEACTRASDSLSASELEAIYTSLGQHDGADNEPDQDLQKVLIEARDEMDASITEAVQTVLFCGLSTGARSTFMFKIWDIAPPLKFFVALDAVGNIIARCSRREPPSERFFLTPQGLWGDGKLALTVEDLVVNIARSAEISRTDAEDVLDFILLAIRDNWKLVRGITAVQCDTQTLLLRLDEKCKVSELATMWLDGFKKPPPLTEMEQALLSLHQASVSVLSVEESAAASTSTRSRLAPDDEPPPSSPRVPRRWRSLAAVSLASAATSGAVMYLSAAGSHSVYVSETSWFKGGSDDSPRWCLDPQAAARKFSTMGVELTDPRGLQLSNLNSAAPVQWEGSSRFHDSKVSVSLEVPSVGDCAVLLRTRVMGSPTDATAWNQAISEMAELSLHQNRN